jgi:hypothetical protein
MKNKIKNHFINLGSSKFIFITIITLLTLDIINSYYLSLYWDYKNFTLIYVEKMAATQGLDIHELSTQSLQEIKQMITNGVSFFLLIIILNNLFFYFFYWKKKIWAQGYVLFYTLTNALLAIAFLIEGPVLGLSWYAYNVLSVPFYLYFYLGIKIFKFKSFSLNPEHEKKAQ